MSCNQSILDVIAQLHNIVIAVGGTLEAENPTTDLEGEVIINDYFAQVADSMGGPSTDSSGISDDISALGAIMANLAVIAKAIGANGEQ